MVPVKSKSVLPVVPFKLFNVTVFGLKVKLAFVNLTGLASSTELYSKFVTLKSPLVFVFSYCFFSTEAMSKAVVISAFRKPFKS